MATGLGSRCVSAARALPRALWCGRCPIPLTPCFLSSFSLSFPPSPSPFPSTSSPFSFSFSISLSRSLSFFFFLPVGRDFSPFGMFSVRLTSDKTLKTENRCRGGAERHVGSSLSETPTVSAHFAGWELGCVLGGFVDFAADRTVEPH